MYNILIVKYVPLTNLATAGSVVPGPGTVAGMLTGAGVAVATYTAYSLSDDYVGDYLRYIG